MRDRTTGDRHVAAATVALPVLTAWGRPLSLTLSPVGRGDPPSSSSCLPSPLPLAGGAGGGWVGGVQTGYTGNTAGDVYPHRTAPPLEVAAVAATFVRAICLLKPGRGSAGS